MRENQADMVRKQMSEGPGVMEEVLARSIGDTFKFKHYNIRQNFRWIQSLGCDLNL